MSIVLGIGPLCMTYIWDECNNFDKLVWFEAQGDSTAYSLPVTSSGLGMLQRWYQSMV